MVGTPTHLFVEATCFYGRAGLTWKYRPALLTARGRVLFLRPKSHDYEEVKRVTGEVAGRIHLPVLEVSPKEEFLGVEHVPANAPPVFELRSAEEAEIHYQEAYSRKLKRALLVAFALGLAAALSIPFLLPG